VASPCSALGPPLPPCLVCLLLQRLAAVLAAMEDFSGKVDRLLTERDEAKKREAKLKAQLKKEKALRERKERAWQLSTLMSHVVLITYVLCDYNTPAAVKYLAFTGRKRRWPEKTDSDLEGLVVQKFMDCNLDELWDLANKDNPKDPEAFKVAVRYIEEAKLADYVEDQNNRLGFAPPTESLLDRWRERRAMYPEAFRPVDAGLVAEARARKFAHRWRIRWNAWHGGIRVRDELPPEETRAKASHEQMWKSELKKTVPK